MEGSWHLARGKSGVTIDHGDLDADPNALGVANGWIDLTTGKWQPPDPDRLMLMHSPIEYDLDVVASRFESALEQWLPDLDVRAFLQTLIGEAVNGVVKDHLLVVLYGSGASGKTTLIGILRHILGPYFVEPHKSLLVVAKHEHHPVPRLLRAISRMRLAASEVPANVPAGTAHSFSAIGRRRSVLRSYRLCPLGGAQMSPKMGIRLA